MEKVVPKIGCFVWDPGGRLAAALDVGAVTKRLTKAKGVTRFELLDDPFSLEFADSFRQDIGTEKVNRFLWVGRFTRSQMKKIADDFAHMGVNPHLHGWCDLQEQGVAVGGVDRESATRKALTLIEMALAGLRLCEPIEPVEIPASEAVLIVGAGVAGLFTASSLADLGKRVYLVEKESGIGGKVALLSRFYPRLCDPHCGLEFILEKLAGSDLVSFRTLSRLREISGSPGNFLACITSNPRFVDEGKCNGCGACAEVCPKEIERPLEIGSLCNRGVSGRSTALVSPFSKAVHPPVPLGHTPSYVIERDLCPPDCRRCQEVCPTQAVDFDQNPSEEEVRVGAILVTTGWDPYPIEKVEEYGYGRLPNVISNLEMERILAESGHASGNGSSLPLLGKIGFIQCVGSRDDRHLSYCSSVCCSATLKQVIRAKELMPEVSCHVFCMDVRSGGFEEELYRRVREIGDVVFLRDRPARVELDEGDGKLRVTVIDSVLDRKISMKLDLLVLAGGMCPSSESENLASMLNLPRNGYHFFEAHHQCFPEESQRTGIYVGGCAREPMNVAQSIDSAHRAAMKALVFTKGTVRLASSYPVLDKTKCDQCKRCVEDCPFGGFLFDEKGYPYPDLARCRQCGNCMGTCPLAAISLCNNTIKQLAAQIQVLEKSYMAKKEPLVLAFLCENDAYKAARGAVDWGLPVPQNVVYVKVPCAGSVNNALIADALSIGVDGVLIAGCKDDQCHYVKGSQLVQKRSGDLSDKLQRMKIEPQRVRFEHLEIRDSRRYVDILAAYIETLSQMGPNPFKI